MEPSTKAAGDAQVLEEHGRPVLRLHLTNRAAGVAQLQGIVSALSARASATES
jgi:glucose-6-phosphate isomerase